MPLLPVVLTNNLIDLFTMEEGKEVLPSDWANAIGNYFQQSIFPIAGGNVVGAKSAFVSTIGPKFPDSNVLSILQAAFLQFALIVALVPSATSGLPSIPPAAPLILAPVIPIGLSGAPISQIAQTMATIIDVWFKTAIYISGTTVTPVPIPWS